MRYSTLVLMKISGANLILLQQKRKPNNGKGCVSWWGDGSTPHGANDECLHWGPPSFPNSFSFSRCWFLKNFHEYASKWYRRKCSALLAAHGSYTTTLKFWSEEVKNQVSVQRAVVLVSSLSAKSDPHVFISGIQAFSSSEVYYSIQNRHWLWLWPLHS
jgi:hypothetical protein